MFIALDTLFRLRRSKGRNETRRVPAKLSCAPSNGVVIHRVAVHKHATPNGVKPSWIIHRTSETGHWPAKEFP